MSLFDILLKKSENGGRVVAIANLKTAFKVLLNRLDSGQINPNYWPFICELQFSEQFFGIFPIYCL
jgi:hypothetical protein